MMTRRGSKSIFPLSPSFFVSSRVVKRCGRIVLFVLHQPSALPLLSIERFSSTVNPERRIIAANCENPEEAIKISACIIALKAPEGVPIILLNIVLSLLAFFDCFDTHRGIGFTSKYVCMCVCMCVCVCVLEREKETLIHRQRERERDRNN